MPLILRLNGDHTSNASGRLQITKAAADAGKALGLSVDEVLKMARSAAVLTHSYANYRYDDLMFYIHKDTIYGVWLFAPDHTKVREPYAVETDAPVNFIDTKNRSRARTMGITVANGMVTGPCPLCEGEGCAECGEKGWVKRTRADYEELKNLTQLT